LAEAVVFFVNVFVVIDVSIVVDDMLVVAF
jgi:hypothetical protein